MHSALKNKLKTANRPLGEMVRKYGLFRVCVFASGIVHILAYGIYLIATYQPPVSSDDLEISPMTVDIQEIPPELIGGESTPAPVEKKEWEEGENEDGEEPEIEEIDPNALSGEGTDKDGFLYAFNGDKPPTPILDFDVNEFFPQDAKDANIKSKLVVVEVQIDEQGNLQGARVVSGKAGFGFEEAAMKIVQLAEWSPGYLKGKPVKMNHRVPINFQLQN